MKKVSASRPESSSFNILSLPSLMSAEPPVSAYLKFQPNPPSHINVNAVFSFQVYLMDNKDNLKSGCRVPLSVQLVFEDGQVVSNQSILKIIDNPDLAIDKSGIATVKAQISASSVDFENKSFKIQVSPTSDTFPIAAIMSSKITVVRFHLKVLAPLPKEWYKDEGGRDRCLSLPVGLVDEFDREVTNRAIPLKIVLIYSNNVEVKSQTILKITNESPMLIPKDIGKTTIHFRIEEVSKNHQKQSFCLRVEPDIAADAATCDVAPDTSSAVLVLSKRNKKRRGDTDLDTTDSDSVIRQPIKVQKQANSASVSSSSASSAASAAPVLASSTSPSSSSSSSAKSQSVASHSNTTENQDMLAWIQNAAHSFASLEWQFVTEVKERFRTVSLFRCPACQAYSEKPSPQDHKPNCFIRTALHDFKTKLSGISQQSDASATSEDDIESVIEEKKASSSFSLSLSAQQQQQDLEDNSSVNSVTDEPSPPPAAAAADADVFNQSSSSGFLDDFVNLSRENSGNMFAGLTSLGSGAVSPFWSRFADPLPEPPIATIPAEPQVSSVLRSISKFGFPAFNQSGSLLGFYYADDDKVQFFPKDAWSGPETAPVFEQVKQQYDAAVQQKQQQQQPQASDSSKSELLSVAECVTLEQLKQELMLLFYKFQSDQVSNSLQS